MSYDVKRTEYAFLPDGPYPLDARSHFVNFAVANETITGDKVSTVELANESNDTQKFYYHGEIITTTEGGVYQVCGKNQYYSNLDVPKMSGQYQYNATSRKVRVKVDASTYWDSADLEVSWDTFFGATVTVPDKRGIANFSFSMRGSTPSTNWTTFQETVTPNFITSCYLRPLSGGGGGGGSSLVINPSGGLDNPVTGLQIKIPNVSGVQINNAGLSIKVLNPTTDTDGTIHGSGITISANGISLNTGPGLTINDTGQLTVNYGKGLTINPDTNALEVDGDQIRGVHSSVDRTYDVDQNILEGNYVYQEI